MTIDDSKQSEVRLEQLGESSDSFPQDRNPERATATSPEVTSPEAMPETPENPANQAVERAEMAEQTSPAPAENSAPAEADTENLALGDLQFEEDGKETTETGMGATPESENQPSAANAEQARRSQAQLQMLEALQLENESLKNQLAKQIEQAESLKTTSMRLNADFDNFRKRTQKEKEELQYLAKRDIINELLPVVDNFERARAHIRPATDGEMVIHKSYQGVYKDLVNSLKRLGVSAMRPEGQEFDPNYHEAMMREQTSEYPEGAVIEQLVRGYMLGDRVLRHAMVKVAATPEDGAILPEGNPGAIAASSEEAAIEAPSEGEGSGETPMDPNPEES